MPVIRRGKRKLNMPNRRVFRRPLNRIRRRKQGSALSILRRLIEKKHLENSVSSTASTDNGPSNLSLLAQGDTSTTRTGLKISAKNLHLNYSIQWTAGATTSPNVVRVLVFYDKNSQGAPPVGTDFLESQQTLSMYNNINEGKRFVMLYDKMHNNNFPSTTVDNLKNYTAVIKVNKNIFYLGSTATNASLGANSLYIQFVGDNTIASGNSPSYTYNSRLYFDDL